MTEENKNQPEESQYLHEIIKCKESFAYFCETYIMVYNPERGLVHFKLHPFQENKVFPAFESEIHRFIILKKFRQGGLSTLASMYSLWKILFFVDQRILMISITDRDAINLMAMIRLAWDNLPEWMLCETLELSQHSISLETGSTIRCGTPKMGRGYAARIIVIDEAAFIPGMDEVWRGIFPTISGAGSKAKAFIISTVNGLGNWYADTYHDAKDMKNDFHIIDLEYTEHPSYNNEQYRQTMLEQLGPKGFAQEILGEFLSSADTFVDASTIKRIKKYAEDKSNKPEIKSHNQKFWIWKQPNPNRNYLICADVAEGLGGEHDYSAFHVLDLATLEQVAEFCDNTVSTHKFTRIIHEVAKYYNNAIVVVEADGLGSGVLSRLYEDLDYENIYWHRVSKRKVKMGFPMNQKSRPLALDSLNNCLENGYIKIHSTRFVHELESFIFNAKSGKPEARKGRHDDLITSMAVGLFIRNHLSRQLPVGADLSNEDDDDFQKLFDPKYDSELENRNEFGEILKSNEDGDPNHYIQISTSDDEDEALLAEFGWI